MCRDINDLLAMIASRASQEAIFFAIAHQACLPAGDPAVAALASILDNPHALSLQFSHPSHCLPAPFASTRNLVVGIDKLVAVSEPNALGEPRHIVAFGCGTRHIAYPPDTVLHRILHLSYPYAECLKSLVTIMRADTPWSSYAMVLRGHGMAWLPESLVRADLATGKLLRADIPELDIPVSLRLYRSSSDGDTAIDDAWRFFLALSERQSEHLPQARAAH